MIDRSLDGLAMIEAKLPAGEFFSRCDLFVQRYLTLTEQEKQQQNAV